MRLHKARVWKGIVGAAFLLTVGACQSADVGSNPEDEAVPVETTAVLSGSLDGNQKISATTEALSEVSLTPEVNSKIEDIRVEEGDTVEEGQVLAVLDDTDLQNALEQEEANYERAKSSVAISKAGRKGAEASAEQSRVALENADYAIKQAKEQYDQARSNLAEARENDGMSESAAKRSVDTAKRSVETSEQSLETAERNLTNAKRDRDRSKQMLDAGLISEQEMERAESAVDDAEDKVQQAKDAVKDAKDSVVEAEDNLKQARQSYDIDRLESQADQAKSAWEEAKASKKELRTNIKSANAGVDEADGGIQDANAALDQARIAVEQAEEQLEDAVVRAPSSGKVLNINGEIGELYAQQEPLLMLGEMNVLNATASVTPEQLMLFEEGQTVDVRFPTVEKEISGDVTYVASSADDNGMFTVEVQVPNPDNELQSGIYSELLIEETYVENSLLVPTESLIDVEGKPSVFVVDGEKSSLVPVEVIREESDMTAIEADLEPNSLVVTRGQYFLEDGATVEDVTGEEEEASSEGPEEKEDGGGETS